MKRLTVTFATLFLAMTTWTGYAAGQGHPDPNDLVEVRRKDIAKCRAMAERWEEKTRACDEADARAEAEQRNAQRLYERNEALIRENEKLRAERELARGVAVTGGVVAVALTLILVFR